MRYSPKIFSRSILCELLNAPQDGRTPLHWAATSNSVDIARYLIDQGADVNRGDSGGWTPLHIAGMPATSKSFTGHILLRLCANVRFLASVWWFRGRGNGTTGFWSRCEPGKREGPHCSVSFSPLCDVAVLTLLHRHYAASKSRVEVFISNLSIKLNPRSHLRRLEKF